MMAEADISDQLQPDTVLLVEDHEAYFNKIHKRDIKTMRVEVAEWLGDILGEKISSNGVLRDLKTGVRLLQVAKTINLIKSDVEKNAAFLEFSDLNPEIEDETHHSGAQVLAKRRINIAKFLQWCREAGVRDITLFETEDLALEKNERQVLNCILNITKIVAKYGIEPPHSVKEELKLEELRKLSMQKFRLSTEDKAQNRLSENQPTGKNGAIMDAVPATKVETPTQVAEINMESGKEKPDSTEKAVQKDICDEQIDEVATKKIVAKPLVQYTADVEQTTSFLNSSVEMLTEKDVPALRSEAFESSEASEDYTTSENEYYTAFGTNNTELNEPAIYQLTTIDSNATFGALPHANSATVTEWKIENVFVSSYVTMGSDTDNHRILVDSDDSFADQTLDVKVDSTKHSENALLSVAAEQTSVQKKSLETLEKCPNPVSPTEIMGQPASPRQLEKVVKRNSFAPVSAPPVVFELLARNKYEANFSGDLDEKPAVQKQLFEKSEEDLTMSISHESNVKEVSTTNGIEYQSDDTSNEVMIDFPPQTKHSENQAEGDEVIIDFPPRVSTSLDADCTNCYVDKHNLKSSTLHELSKESPNNTDDPSLNANSIIKQHYLPVVTIVSPPETSSKTFSETSPFLETPVAVKIDQQAESSQQSTEPQGLGSNFTTDKPPETTDISQNYSLPDDITRYINDMGDIYTLSSKVSVKKYDALPTENIEASEDLPQKIDSVEGQTTRVGWKMDDCNNMVEPDVGSIDPPARLLVEERPATAAASPTLLEEKSPTECDTTSDVFRSDFPVERGELGKQIIEVSDRYRVPIAITSVVLIVAIAAIIVMSIIFPSN